jgi:hypothetical protein
MKGNDDIHRRLIRGRAMFKHGGDVDGEKGQRCQKKGLVDGRLSYQSSYGFASGQIPRHSQGTLLPSSGERKVSNPRNNVQHNDSI